MWVVSKDWRPSIAQQQTLRADSDPLPFQWLARDADLCRNVQFVDVDYKALMYTKKEIVESTPQIKRLLTLRTPPLDGYTLVNADEYLAIGCDLRDITGLNKTIRSISEPKGCLVLCVAEVSVTYMNSDAADTLIEWAAVLSSGKPVRMVCSFLPLFSRAYVSAFWHELLLEL